ncbi:hypothetical protein M8C21_015110 [Ambrosia artemisiifolia]|uniref:Uncharacterized protein n=1 Tax=Ambrosia artemisiifolia TaxID=4212 RepID=A0AAD5D9K0_AMBAR|nr:hypothetical protein M8C21_015110 [Ambrosia artemisiifolia]
MKLKKLLFLLLSSILYSHFTFTQSANLHSQEVEILKQIGEKLGLSERKGWNFDKDPCTGEGKWGASVSCDCSFESNTTCRITQIYITSENVSAALPSEFAKLQNLMHLDLNRNYFHGTIPSEWATMRLNFLILLGNRLSGPFPTTLTRMTTLQVLIIDGNQFSGPIPKEIANLRNLEKLSLSSNDFSGRLPIALAKLSNLTDV